jgi:hypothetical protein
MDIYHIGTAQATGKLKLTGSTDIVTKRGVRRKTARPDEPVIDKRRFLK